MEQDIVYVLLGNTPEIEFGVMLTEKQAKQVTDVSIRRRDPRSYKLSDAGYVAPGQFTSYLCTKCGVPYDGAPQVDVTINEEDNMDAKLLGDMLNFNILGNATYYCNRCSAYLGHTFVTDEDHPHISLIRSDFSGKFIPITQQFIDEMLEESRRQADDGALSNMSFNLAQRLAGKIQYDVSEKCHAIESLNKMRYLENYENGIAQKIVGMAGTIRENFGRIHEIDGEMLDPNWEDMSELLDNLPQIKLPEDDDFRNDLSYILGRYKEQFLVSEIGRIADEIKEREASLAKYKKQLSEFERIEKLATGQKIADSP